LAAKVGLGVDIQDLPDYTDTNVTGTATLLAAMAAQEIRTLVLASSMVVYGEGLGQCLEHGGVRPAQRRQADLRRRLARQILSSSRRSTSVPARPEPCSTWRLPGPTRPAARALW
jgi:nucleoside-diphosphate-sugar epimerase